MQAVLTAAGVIQPLVHLLSSPNTTADARAAAAKGLWRMARTAGNKVSIAAAGAISPLVEVVRSGSVLGKEHAAAALQNLVWSAD